MALVAVGTSVSESENENHLVTWDCWKPILHDQSTEPSLNGKLFKELIEDNRVKQVTIDYNNYDYNDLVPKIILCNVWDEQFKIDFVLLPPDSNNRIAAHATRI